jgi:hypothetical protein
VAWGVRVHAGVGWGGLAENRWVRSPKPRQERNEAAKGRAGPDIRRQARLRGPIRVYAVSRNLPKKTAAFSSFANTLI